MASTPSKTPNMDQEKNINTQEQDGAGISLQFIIDALVVHWNWFLISIFGCILAAALYLRYKSPIYATTAEVLIKEEDPYKSRMRGNTLADFTQLGFMTNSNGFDNEIEIMGSKALAKRAVTNLKLYTCYYYKGRIRDLELYRGTPIIADMDPVDLDTLSGVVVLKIDQVEQGFEITGKVKKEEFEAQVRNLPARIKTPAGWVTLSLNPGQEFEDRQLKVFIYRPSLMANAMLNATTLEPLSKTTTIASFTVQDNMPQRAEDYLNELIKVYNEDANELKNEVALKTEIFINNRIKIIDQELGSTESQLESYKKQNRLVDLSNDAQAAYKGVEYYQNQQIELQTQMMLVKSLKDYVDNSDNYMEIIPANLGLSDASLIKTINEYNQQVIERKRLLKTAAESSPVVVAATNAIATLFPGIRHSLTTVYDNLKTQKRNVDEQYDQFISRLYGAPTQERVLTDIGRQQSVKAALYQILLQKREENAISLASTVDKAQVIEIPESSIRPISPKRKVILLIALVLGMGLPFAIIYLLDLLRFRIEGRNDIEKITDLTILADIFHDKTIKEGERAIVVRENNNDMMEETFRNLRANLRFVMKGDEKVLICTSFIPGEGKTFVSTNLAMSMALMGKKVIVVGLDIRKPRLNELFKLNASGKGITLYLAGDQNTDQDLRDQICPSGINENLDVLPAGIIPPNPAELLSSEQLSQAFTLLRQWYDFVIVDTPPLGLVSDTLLLNKIADATIVVCRSDYSLKRGFEMVNEIAHSNKLPKVNLVLNGVNLAKKKYGYYYGYGKYGQYNKYGSYGRYGHYGMAEGQEGKHHHKKYKE